MNLKIHYNARKTALNLTIPQNQIGKVRRAYLKWYSWFGIMK